MPNLAFGCLATMIGSLPHRDPAEACSLVLHYLKDLPAWPQLPHRSFRENMYAQYSEGFPGIVIRDGRIYVDRSANLHPTLEKLYTAYLSNDFDSFPISPGYAAGLHHCLSLKDRALRGVKGQVTGPVTWGTTVMDSNQKAIIYDDTLSDAAARLLRLKATWQEKKLKELTANTVIFIDEPSLASFGSAFFPVSKAKVVSLLEEVLGGIHGVKGIHCCGNTDWPVLLGTSTDILSFDAYNYGPSLSLYPAEVKDFFARGKTIAWGIVPIVPELLAGETVASLKDRLEETMAPFTRNGISFRQIIQQGLLTPSCGLDSLSVNVADRVLELLADLSTEIRRLYR